MANSAAEEASTAKSLFLANMSHEVRTPMNGILQILDVVGEHVGDADRALIDKGRQAGHALLRILNGILDYSKLAHAGAIVKLGRTDIVEVCRTVTELHTAAAVSKGVALRSRVELPASGESNIVTDEVKLFEIVNNLTSNALKFTASGVVEIVIALAQTSSDSSAARLAISVSDSGCGIEEADLDKIFLPFYQRQRESRSGAQGAGLGLSIVKELAQVLGGDVAVQSKAGHGSTFTVDFPVTLARRERNDGVTGVREESDKPPVAFAHGEFAGLRLLLVDDNELNAMLASRLLTAIGFDVVVAADGALAVQRVLDGRFDMILMDCQMPVMDGYDATRAIRELEKKNGVDRTPIIGVTAYALSGDREKCLASGMDDFLAKPYALSDLRPKLRLHLERRARATR